MYFDIGGGIVGFTTGSNPGIGSPFIHNTDYNDTWGLFQDYKSPVTMGEDLVLLYPQVRLNLQSSKRRDVNTATANCTPYDRACIYLEELDRIFMGDKYLPSLSIVRDTTRFLPSRWRMRRKPMELKAKPLPVEPNTRVSLTRATFVDGPDSDLAQPVVRFPGFTFDLPMTQVCHRRSSGGV